MIDFLRANPFVSKEEYLWKWTVGQIKLASYDFTHVEYLSESERKIKDAKYYDNVEDFANDLGCPIL